MIKVPPKTVAFGTARALHTTPTRYDICQINLNEIMSVPNVWRPTFEIEIHVNITGMTEVGSQQGVEAPSLLM